MKAIVSLARILVGILFIFSGFIKLNDPVGFSFKLQEYFSEPVLDIPFLIPFALIIAILIVIFELVLGIMLLIGYAPKFTSWSLLVSMEIIALGNVLIISSTAGIKRFNSSSTEISSAPGLEL